MVSTNTKQNKYIKWDTDRKEHLKYLVGQNLSNKMIADLLDCSVPSVTSMKNRLGLTNPQGIKWTHKMLWEFNNMYISPYYTADDIAEYFNIKKSSVYQIASKNCMIKGKYEDEGKRVCTRCGQLYPATTEFFHNNNRNKKIKLSAWCKKCWSEYKKELSRK